MDLPRSQPDATGVQQRSAHDTIRHLAKGIALVQTLPDSPARMQQELTLQLALGAPLIAAKGHAAPEVEELYARARALCQQTGDTQQLFPILWGVAINATVRGELRLAREVTERLQQLAQQPYNPSLLLEANILCGALLVWLGDTVTGRVQLEQAVTLCDDGACTSHTFLYGHEPAVVCRVVLSKALWLLGYPAQALRKSQEALTLAQAASHRYSHVFALNWATMLRLLHRQPSLALEHAQAARVIAREQGFAHLEAVILALEGGARAALGERTDGIAQIQSGVSACRNTGAELVQPYLLALLADAHARAGQRQEGLSVVDEGIRAAWKTGEQWYEAELQRLKGELLINTECGMQNDEGQTQDESQKTVRIHQSSFILHRFEEAKACFLNAIHLARRQQTKSLEVRAAMSLVRLRQQHASQQGVASVRHGAQGKLAEAHRMLSATYNWFTEGFDTPDLREAKVLLHSFS